MGTPRTMTPEKLWAKTEKVGDCWIWQGKARVGPYGSAGFNWKQWLAHRLSYFFYHGEIDERDVIRHTCDTPLCINPQHLIAGSQQDNMDDMVERGRSRTGEKHHAAILSTLDVDLIRYWAQHGVQQKELAEEFGVSKQQISRIVRGERWKGD